MVQHVPGRGHAPRWAAEAGHEAVAECAPGEALDVGTLDCRAETIRGPEDLAKVHDASHINPVTGPIVVSGATAGQTLEVSVSAIVPDGEPLMLVREGVTTFDFVDRPALAFPERGEGTVTVSGVATPLAPMVGFLATAPAEGSLSGAAAGATGGNLDTPLLGPGASVLLPVEVDGAHLFVGDVHLCQGDGELFLTGAECSAVVRLSCRPWPGLSLGFPVVRTGEVLAVIGEGRTLDEAADLAAHRAVDLLGAHAGLSAYDAGFLLSAMGDLRVCRFLPDYGSVCRVELPLDIWEDGYWEAPC